MLHPGGVRNDPVFRRVAWCGSARCDRHLAIAARDIEHVGGLTEPRDPAAQDLDEPSPFLDAEPEMAGAAGEIGMVQVIGFDPHRDETAEQRLQHGSVIIDPAQQHALRQDWNPGTDEPPDSLTYLRGQFARMIGVDHDIDRLLCRERSNENWPNPSRLYDRHAGMKADGLNVRDRVERPHDHADAPRRQQKRIAAGNDDLPNLLMLADVIESAFERLGRQHPIILADLLAPEAEAAIHRANEDWL